MLAAALTGLLAACGSSGQPQVQSSRPLTAQSVAVKQTGNGAAQIVPTTVTYQIDDSGALVIQLSVQSQSTAAESIMVRASLFDSDGGLIGDAAGGRVAVAPGSTTMVQLNGPRPQGTIAGATFEVTDVTSPTPVVNTPIPTGTFTP